MNSGTVSADVSKTTQPRSEHPRPDLLREQWMNLNGTWEFEIDHSVTGEERNLFEAPSLKQKITVPFCPESDLSGIGNKDFMACVWYRRCFTLPKEWSGKRVLLHIGACDYEATIWVNAKKAGGHRGGYSSFSLDITALLDEGQNTIVIKALDDTRSPLQPTGKQSPKLASFACLYTRTTGIWQTVWLEAVPSAYIRSIKCIADIAQKRANFFVQIDGQLQQGELTAEVLAEGKTVARAQALVSGSSAQLSVDLPQVQLWEPGKPYLYDLVLRLEGQGQEADVVKSYFGMREIVISGKKVLINGKSVYQRLVLDQGFYPDGIYTAPSDEALRKDIEISLAAGFNGARLHEKIFESRFLYWADRLGYLVWGEYPNWGLDHAAPQALERVLSEWLETLERDFNHPSIVGWCPFNETNKEQNPELLRLVYRATKAADPTRPVIDTSGYVHVETDIYDSHDYEQDVVKLAEHHDGFKTSETPWRNNRDADAPYLGQPYFVSEYGGIWWGVDDGRSWGYGERPKSAEEMIERYRALTTYLLRHPKMFAFCYTQLTDVEQEQNGVYTYDRKAKFDPAVFKAINEQKAAIEE